MKYISQLILKLWGWKVEGNPRNDISHRVFAVVPHTSSWDFIVAILLKWSLQLKNDFVAKKSLFRPPWGWFFRALGGHPVDRSQSQNVVEAIVQLMKSKNRFSLGIAPEGTRKKVNKLKTGFYQIAKGAGAPILLVRFDYSTKTVTISEPFYPTTDEAADWQYINQYYKGAKGKIPSLSFDPDLNINLQS